MKIYSLLLLLSLSTWWGAFSQFNMTQMKVTTESRQIIKETHMQMRHKLKSNIIPNTMKCLLF